MGFTVVTQRDGGAEEKKNGQAIYATLIQSDAGLDVYVLAVDGKVYVDIRHGLLDVGIMPGDARMTLRTIDQRR